MKVSDLVTRAEAALKGKPPIGGSICIDFGSEGVAYVYRNNEVAQIPQVSAADCTISLSLGTLAQLESGDESVVGAVLWGDLKVSGNRDLAEKFGAIVQGTST